jgi:cyclopropane fatty-acyl-phospholipid synthase-like methyltransferase
LPTRFFQLCLGPAPEVLELLLTPPGDETLEQAEEAMLALVRRAARAWPDGQRILELGCGWGSLTL